MRLVGVVTVSVAVIALSITLTSAYGQDNAEPQRLTVAVFDFRVANETQQVEITASAEGGGEKARATKYTLAAVVKTNALTDTFVTELTRSGRVSIVERDRLGDVLKEYDLSEVGMADQATAVKAGKLLSAQMLLFGIVDYYEQDISVSPIPYTTRVRRTGRISIGATIRLVSTETGRVVSAEAARVDHVIENIPEGGGIRAEYIQDAQEELVKKLTYLVLDTVYPTKVALWQADKVYINRGKKNSVENGRRYLVVRPGEELVDPDTHTSLGFSQQEVAVIEVQSVDDKMSIGSVVEWRSAEHTIEKGDLCKQIEAQPNAANTLEPPKASVDRVFK